MTKDTKFWLDQRGARDSILFSDGIEKLEHEYMESVLSQIRAEFLQSFGFPGEFAIHHEPTKTRERYYISSADAKTTRILNKNPGWLAKFVEQPF